MAGCGTAGHEPAPILRSLGEDVSEKLDYTPGGSRSSATSAASGPAPSARPWFRHRFPRSDRQGHPYRGLAGSGSGGQVRRPHAAVTGRRASSPGLAWRCRARRWLSGSEPAACSCSPWWTHSRTRCCATACCMPMRHLWRCWRRARRRRTCLPLGVLPGRVRRPQGCRL